MKRIKQHKIATVSLLIVFALMSWVGIDKYFFVDIDKLNNEMTKLASKYYEENIKGKVIGVDQHEITLEAIKDKGFLNIDGLSKCDPKESKSYVIVENPIEEDIKKIRYKIENHLVCEGYTSNSYK